jgi:hypothetical protein
MCVRCCAMSGSRTIGGLAVAAGAMFLSGEALTRVAPDIDHFACKSGLAYLVNVIDLLKYGLMGVALLLVVRVYGNRLHRTGRIIGRVAGVGSMLAGVANGVEHCAHLEGFGALYVAGLISGLIATVLFGGLLARSRAVSPWIGWVMSAGVLSFFLAAEQGGAIVAGLAWILVGTRLISSGRTTPAAAAQ